MSRKINNINRILAKRIKNGFYIFLIIFLALIIRLSYLSIYKYESYSSKIETQSTQKVNLNSGRGIIYDRNNNPLTDTNKTQVIIMPKSVITDNYKNINTIKTVTADNLNLIEIYGENKCEKEALKFIMDIITADISKSRGYELEIYINLMRFWLLLVLNENDIFSQKTEPKPINEERVKDVLSFIHKNYSNKITLQDIADSVFVSKGECCRFFKKSLKMSPYDYLINYRINESMKLLKNTSFSILDIAENVGFNNVSHYIQIFKKKTGQTPHEYRNS